LSIGTTGSPKATSSSKWPILGMEIGPPGLLGSRVAESPPSVLWQFAQVRLAGLSTPAALRQVEVEPDDRVPRGPLTRKNGDLFTKTARRPEDGPADGSPAEPASLNVLGTDLVWHGITRFVVDGTGGTRICRAGSSEPAIVETQTSGLATSQSLTSMSSESIGAAGLAGGCSSADGIWDASQTS
jgi:hypothetical protein